MAGHTAECLLLSSRFRRTGPAAAPHTSDTVITCEKPPAQWMGIDRQGTFSALAPTTHSGMSVGDCQQRGMQPGHPESRARAQTAASVDPMRWAQTERTKVESFWHVKWSFLKGKIDAKYLFLRKCKIDVSNVIF